MAEKQMSLAKACELWNKDKKNEAAQEVIKDRIGHRAVIVLDASGQIVIPDTLENLDIAKSHPGNDEQADCVSPSKLFAAAQPKFKGDPIDRRLLRSSGVTATEPKVDWSMVPDNLRLVAGYAAEVGEVGNTATASESAAHNLRQPPSAWSPPWPRMLEKWDKLNKAEGKTEAEKALIARVEARLWVPQIPFADRAAPVATPAPADPGAKSRPTLLVVHAGDAGPFYKSLEMHLATARRRGLVLDSIKAVPYGVNIEDVQGRKLAAASWIVILLTPSMNSEWELAERALRTGKVVVPVMCRSTVIDESLGRLVALPRSGRWLTSPDSDAMADVARDLATTFGF